MEFLSRQTFACRENGSVWTERQTDKIGKNIFHACNHMLPMVKTLAKLTNLAT